MVGLVPENPKQFEFDEAENSSSSSVKLKRSSNNPNKYYLTQYTDTKMKEGEAVIGQLEKMLRRIIYSTRNSAKIFYGEENERTYSPSIYND